MSRSHPASATAVAPPAVAPPPSALASVAVGIAALAATLAFTTAIPADKDSGEFALVLARLGLAHPTGYPLYTLAGHVFVVLLHAAGASWTYAANAFSALGAALAMGLLHALGARLLHERRVAHAGWVALLPVLAFAPQPAWTSIATLAEVYSWHAAWVALACLAAWSGARTLADARAGESATRRVALLWGAIVGAGLAHHLTSVFFAAPLTLALATLVARRPRGRVVLALTALVGAVPPLLTLGYVA